MPWQQYVADVAMEVDPDTGRLVYREVVLTVPRQSGKTTLMLSAMVQRALGFKQRQNIMYTAQTRGAARKKWEDDHVQTLESSKYRKMFKVRKQLGQEAIRWKNGSLHGITSTTEKAGHGETLDLGVVDEAFAQEDDRLEQAFKPAMITRPQPQLWVVSTAGTLKSAYLRGKVDDGRARCEDGATESVAYFEWSAPDDADPADPATWWACMPALGQTVTEDAIRADFTSMKLSEFRRAYLNQWPDAAPDRWLVIDEPTWASLAELDPPRPDDPVALAIDVTPDRSRGCIALAGRRSDGLMQVEIPGRDDGTIDEQDGTAWIVPRVADMVSRLKPCAVSVLPSSPAGSLIPDLEREGIEVLSLSPQHYAQACGQFYDMSTQRQLRHLGQQPIAAALAGALKRELGEGAWMWNRKAVTVNIAPLVAATLAVHGHATKAHKKKIEPFVMWG